MLTISSLARAVSGNASLSDVGALAWMTLRNVVPATAMALFVEDERQDLMTVAYAAGTHAAMLRQLKKARGGGIAGWVAVNRRGVLNAEAALDLGLDAPSLEPPLRSSLTVPLAHDGRVVGVLSCYSRHARGSPKTTCACSSWLAASLGSALAAVGTRRAPRCRWPPTAAAEARASCRWSALTVLSIAHGKSRPETRILPSRHVR